MTRVFCVYPLPRSRARDRSASSRVLRQGRRRTLLFSIASPKPLRAVAPRVFPVSEKCNMAMVASNMSGHIQKQLTRSLERILEEAHLSGELKLSGRKLKDFPKVGKTGAAKYNLQDTVIAGESVSYVFFEDIFGVDFTRVRNTNIRRKYLYIGECLYAIDRILFVILGKTLLFLCALFCNIAFRLMSQWIRVHQHTTNCRIHKCIYSRIIFRVLVNNNYNVTVIRNACYNVYFQYRIFTYRMSLKSDVLYRFTLFRDQTLKTEDKSLNKKVYFNSRSNTYTWRNLKIFFNIF